MQALIPRGLVGDLLPVPRQQAILVSAPAIQANRIPSRVNGAMRALLAVFVVFLCLVYVVVPVVLAIVAVRPT